MAKQPLLLSLFFLLLHPFVDATICLNMIVKNESRVIERCLNTVKPLIDTWVIVDTGSTDGTQEIIQKALKTIPGALYERAWVNFEHNRNEALDLAKGKADYILIIDADEQLLFQKDFKLPPLTLDSYTIITEHSGSKYQRRQLIKSALPWRWVGVLHETLECPQAHTFATLQGIENLYGFDGCRSQDPKKFEKDAALLEEALKKEPANTRYLFYLAQSYKDARNYPKAIDYYKKRAAMGGWQEEVYTSLYQIAQLQEWMQEPLHIVSSSYIKAYQAAPAHAEPLYRLALLYRLSENYLLGYLVSKYALTISPPKGALFVEMWVYDHALLLEHSLCAYYLGKYKEAKQATDRLLLKPDLPAHIKECAEKNLTWIAPKAAEERSA